MIKARISVLRGICQTPAYVAHERGFFAAEGVESTLHVEPTAWMVPTRLMSGESQFAVIPWTRVAAAEEKELPLVLVAGSGHEEAAIVVRRGLALDRVRRVSVPQRGGMKDLTALGLIDSLGWKDVELLRQPSGDGSIISFFGEGVDAASMVEPYATMMEELGVGTVARRTGDVWPGAPGCSLTTTANNTRDNPALVQSVVRAFARAERFVGENPAETAEIAHRYIGVHPRFIEKAIARNRPDADAVRNQAAMDKVLSLMLRLGYIGKIPEKYLDLSFLDRARASGAG